MSITVHILLSAMRAVKKTGLIKGPDTDVDENLRKAREYNRRHLYKEPADRKVNRSPSSRQLKKQKLSAIGSF